jgi:hypothetical protein
MLNHGPARSRIGQEGDGRGWRGGTYQPLHVIVHFGTAKGVLLFNFIFALVLNMFLAETGKFRALQ